VILLTQNSTFIIGPVAQGLGFIMDAIFNFLDLLSIPKVGIAIVLFTIVIYMLMTPLTYRQQKFSKMSAIMNPEIQAVQAKYKGKRDNESMQAQNAETQAIYKKYGVSPSGSCVQLLIQMPILFALYRVIYAMPAYVTKIKDAFVPYVDGLMKTDGAAAYVSNSENISSASQFANQITDSADFQNAISSGTFDVATGSEAYDTASNTIIDILNRASSADLNSLNENFSGLSGQFDTMTETLDRYNVLFGLNMGQSPSSMISEFWANGAIGMIIVALMIPLLAAATQWISIKLNPQQNQNANSENAMASSMKTMNYVMPIMSLVFCFTLPSGLGLYWIMGAVVRTVQQIIINRHIDKTDINELLEQNKEKNEKKSKKRNERLEKAGIDPNSLSNAAKVNTRNINSSASSNSTSTPTSTGSGSLASKAGLVKKYNENNKK
jgi:YidC/Oxa1 family membrane protein insertase